MVRTLSLYLVLINVMALRLPKNGKVLGTHHNVVLSSLTFMVGSINLIGGYHHECERNEHYITML